MTVSCERASPDDIETARLILRPIAPEAMHAGLSGDLGTIEAHLGARVPMDLLQEPAVLSYALAQLDADADYLPWSARAIILKEPMQMIGHVRFHSRPDPDYLHPYARDSVEFGYVVFADYRKRGFAREALTGVMQWARETHGVHRFIASVSPDNLPSLSLVRNLGFQKVEEHVDAVDGIEHVYLLDVRAGS